MLTPLPQCQDISPRWVFIPPPPPVPGGGRRPGLFSGAATTLTSAS